MRSAAACLPGERKGTTNEPGTDEPERTMTDTSSTLRDGLGLMVLIGIVGAATMWGGVLG